MEWFTIQDMVARIGLAFSNQPLLLPLVLCGYLLHHRTMWSRTLMLMFCTMPFNAYLKSLWKVPLAAHIGKEGWAFPSGHMQAATAFYGWLAIAMRKRWLCLLVTLILVGVGYGLLFFRYHVLIDVIAAIGFAALTLLFFFVVFTFSQKYHLERYEAFFGFMLNFVWIALLPEIPPHLWMAQGGLLGLGCGTLLFEDIPLPHTKVQKVLTLIVGFLLVGFLYWLWNVPLAPFFEDKRMWQEGGRTFTCVFALTLTPWLVKHWQPQGKQSSIL